MKRFMAAALAVGCLVSPATVFAPTTLAFSTNGCAGVRARLCDQLDGLVDRASAARELPHI
jgi:hypothetical protein